MHSTLSVIAWCESLELSVFRVLDQSDVSGNSWEVTAEKLSQFKFLYKHFLVNMGVIAAGIEANFSRWRPEELLGKFLWAEIGAMNMQLAVVQAAALWFEQMRTCMLCSLSVLVSLWESINIGIKPVAMPSRQLEVTWSKPYRQVLEGIHHCETLTVRKQSRFKWNACQTPFAKVPELRHDSGGKANHKALSLSWQ